MQSDTYTGVCVERFLCYVYILAREEVVIILKVIFVWVFLRTSDISASPDEVVSVFGQETVAFLSIRRLNNRSIVCASPRFDGKGAKEQKSCKKSSFYTAWAKVVFRPLHPYRHEKEGKCRQGQVIPCFARDGRRLGQTGFVRFLPVE